MAKANRFLLAVCFRQIRCSCERDVPIFELCGKLGQKRGSDLAQTDTAANQFQQFAIDPPILGSAREQIRLRSGVAARATELPR